MRGVFADDDDDDDDFAVSPTPMLGQSRAYKINRSIG